MIPAPVSEFLGDNVTFLIIWVVFIGGLLLLLRKFWPDIVRFIKLVDVLSDLPETLGRIVRQVENDHPSEPNLREELTAMAKVVDKVHSEQKAIHQELRDLDTKTIALSEWQEAHDKSSAAVLVRVEKIEEEIEDRSDSESK